MLRRRYATQIAARAQRAPPATTRHWARTWAPDRADRASGSRAGLAASPPAASARPYSDVSDGGQRLVAKEPLPVECRPPPRLDASHGSPYMVPTDRPPPRTDHDSRTPPPSHDAPPSPAHNIVDLQKSLVRLRAALVRQDGARAGIIAQRYARTVALTSPPESAGRKYDRLLDVFLGDDVSALPATAPALCEVLQHPEDRPVCSDGVAGRIASLAIRDTRYLPVLSVLFGQDPPTGDGPVFQWVARGLLDRVSDPSVLTKVIFEHHPDGSLPRAELTDPAIWTRLIQASKRKPVTRRNLIKLFRRVCEPSKIPEDDDTAEARERAARLARPFSAFLAQCSKDWMDHSSRRETQGGTSFPRTVATELSELIGWSRMPAHFLNEWMRAETATSNYDMAEMVWKTFYTAHSRDRRAAADAQDRLDRSRLVVADGAQAEWTVAEAAALQRVVEENSHRPVPDATTYRLYFKLYRSLANPEPLRATLSSMLDNIPRDEVDCTLLNTLLSAVLSKVHTDDFDLPLFYLVLCMYDPNPFDRGTTWGPRPDARTVNVAAGGMAQLWRRTGAVLDPLWEPHVAASVRRRTEAWRTGRTGKGGLPRGPGPLRTGVHPDEWKMLSGALDGIVPLPATAMGARGAKVARGALDARTTDLAETERDADPTNLAARSPATPPATPPASIPAVYLPLGKKGFIHAQDPTRVTQRAPDRLFLASRPDEPVPPAPDMPATWQDMHNAQRDAELAPRSRPDDPATGEILRAIRVLVLRATRLVLQDTAPPGRRAEREMLDKALAQNLDKVWAETGHRGPGRLGGMTGGDGTGGDGAGTEEVGGDAPGAHRLARSTPESDGRIRAELGREVEAERGRGAR